MDNKMVIKDLCLLGLFLFLCCSLVLTASVPQKESKTERTGKLFSSSYALVIGIDQYENWPDLKNAEKDAESIAIELKKKGFQVMYKRKLNVNELESVFKEFFYNRSVKNNSRLFVWFSGHGHTINGEGFLIPADAPEKYDDDFVREAYPVRRFDELSRLTKARNVYLVFDSCLSNPILIKDDTVSLSLSFSPKTQVRQFLCSGNQDQERLDNGSFREAFIDAINNKQADANKDSYLTANEIGLFIKKEILSSYYGKLKDFSGGDFVFSFKGKDEDNKEIRPPEMVIVPAGTFLMGAVQGGGYSNEVPVHEVKVASFAVGKYEVTFDEYDLFCAATGREKPDDNGWGRGRRPVINVSWEDANAYCKWLSEQTKNTYRLPTEAEWEYMARAGTKEKYHWGNELTKADKPENARAACYGCGAQWGWDAERKTAPVGSFEPNNWVIYDTVGNVWEWTCSEYTDSYIGKETENIGDISTSMKSVVIRGGAWDEKPRNCRAAHRRSGYPGERSKYIGFRVVRELEK